LRESGFAPPESGSSRPRVGFRARLRIEHRIKPQVGSETVVRSGSWFL
jgi:hypothetical protein